ncbi:lytic transglycosylase domain-containing protein [Ruegeria sp. 2012CJ41-6]|uniref:Lytic transglycosylase domain-containing protein n=1 Tax=Ruegeria spongiae TaxID=2942209 RepID=A0ABT0Q674_9RHOB|nr:lytic transglycosylase domain-containing protein [Ruegeria spongiae]MCL6285335.1 lytic transglycosylase domain-containing protein [Ruegeria spongiae]
MFLNNSLTQAGLAVAAGLVWGLSGSGTVLAETPFKRITPPSPGTGSRINVQISPEEHATAPYAPSTGYREPIVDVVAPPEPATTPEAAPDRPKSSYAWFWDKISPALEDARPGRLTAAMQAVSNGGVAAPRLQSMQDIAKERGIPILQSTVGTNVSPALVLAVIAVESSGKVDAVSGAGAQGLMQLMPATAERFGVEDSLSPQENIAGGVKYLDWLMNEFDNDPILVLAGYNAGEGSVRTHKGVPPFAETRDYVPKVLAAFQTARGLCATPPELITDGCVFTVMN